MGMTYDEIESSMRNTYFEKCGKNPDENSFEKKVIEALASELYGLSCLGDYIMKQSFVQTATGEYLDMLGEMRACKRKDESKAEGILRFYRIEPSEEDIPIKKGTICSAVSKPYIQFETTDDAVISAGESCAFVPAQALGGGREYNIPAGEITVMVNAPAMVEGVINEEDFLGGNDVESDNSFRERIIKNYHFPENGAGKISLENKIRSLDFIVDCKFYNALAPGNMNLVLLTKGKRPLTNDEKNKVISCVSFGEIVGVTFGIAYAGGHPLRITANVTLAPAADQESVKAYIEKVLKDMLDLEVINKSVPVSKVEREILKNKDIADVNLVCSKIVNGVFLCPSQSILELSRVTVNFKYE